MSCVQETLRKKLPTATLIVVFCSASSPLIAALTHPRAPSGELASLYVRRGDIRQANLRRVIQQTQSTRLRKTWRGLTLEGFSIQMPGKPMREVSTVKTAVGPTQQYTYTVDLGTEGYSVSYQDLPPSKWNTNNVGLEGLQKGFLKLGGQILSDREISISTYKGREIIFTDRENLLYRLNAYSVGPRLYQIFYLTAGKSVHSDEISKFFRSFAIDEEFARGSSEKRIEDDSERLAQDLSSDFPQFSQDDLKLLSKEIIRQRLTPAEAGRFGWQIMGAGVLRLNKGDQEEFSDIRSQMFLGLTTQEMAIFNLLYEKASSGSLTKEETEYSRLLLTKAFESLSLANKARFRFLMGKALRLALPTL
jgi:hypothetical protein